MLHRFVRSRYETAFPLHGHPRILDLTVASLMLLPVAMAFGQAGDLLRQGSWTIASPDGCGTLPLLTVKGPSSLFEPSSATALKNLQKALAAPLARACPGVREAVLVNGRSRRLIRLDPPTADAGSSSPVVIYPAPPAGSPPVQAAVPPVRPAPNPSFENAQSIPSLSQRSALPSLGSARGAQAKCDVLFRWLESGKLGASPSRAGYPLPPRMMDIFRDESMVAVFGKPYEEIENRARIELYEKNFAKCMGEQRRSPNQSRNRPLQIGGITFGDSDAPLPREYPQQFQQYREIVQQAFQGHPGRFEPAVITQQVQQLRRQTAWAIAAMSSAAQASPNAEGFTQIADFERQIATDMALLFPEQRDTVRQYLVARQRLIAPTVVHGWLAQAEQRSPTLEAAAILQTEHHNLGDEIGLLDPVQRTSAESDYTRLLDANLTPTLQAETAKVAAFPASWIGAQELGAWESAFIARFTDFRATSAFKTAAAQFQAARSRIYPAALPVWRKAIDTAPATLNAMAGQRDQLKSLFASDEDRASPLYADFEKPITSRQSQIQARIDEDERKRLAEAERAAAAAAQQQETREAKLKQAGPANPRNQTQTIATASSLTASSLNTGSGAHAELFRHLYLGEFDKMELNRTSVDLQVIGAGYMEGFSAKCYEQLPPNKVELMETVCDLKKIYYQFGIQHTACYSSHQRGNGVFVDPQLHDAFDSISVQALGGWMNNGSTAVLQGGGNIFQNIANVKAELAQTKADAARLPSENNCAGPAIQRFQENLQRLALGQEGKRLDGTVQLGVAMLPPAAGETYPDSNYSKLLEEMVTEQAKTWMMNRYIPGSTHNVRVAKRDTVGRPASVTATYSFNKEMEGTVTLTFLEGKPTCLFFFDQPTVCKTPAPRLTSAYVAGSYR